MREKIEYLVKEIVKNKFSVDTDIKLEIPDNPDFGDFTLPCFQFAKTLRKAPPIIANEIKAAIEESNSELIKETNNVGAYLNIKVNKAAFFYEIFSF